MCVSQVGPELIVLSTCARVWMGGLQVGVPSTRLTRRGRLWCSWWGRQWREESSLLTKERLRSVLRMNFHTTVMTNYMMTFLFLFYTLHFSYCDITFWTYFFLVAYFFLVTYFHILHYFISLGLGLGNYFTYYTFIFLLWFLTCNHWVNVLNTFFFTFC